VITEQHEIEVLKGCIFDNLFMSKAANMLDKHSFLSKPHAWLYKTIRQQYSRHSEMPTKLYAQTEIADIKDKALKAECETLVNTVFNGRPPKGQQSSVELLEKFVRFRRLQAGITKSLDLLDKGKVDEAFDEIGTAHASGRLSTNVEIKWIEEFDHRQADRLKQRSAGNALAIPTKIKALDDVIVGISPGELGLVGAVTKRGKSIFLNHLGFMAAISGWNVLHFTLEMPAIQVATRYDSRLLRIPHKRLKMYNLTPAEEQFIKATIKRRRKTLLEKLFIVSFPVRACNITHLREVIKQRTAEGHKPDLILVDSGDHMNAQRSHNNFRLDTAQVFWELKGLADDPQLGARVWSSTQVTKEYANKIAGIGSASESFDKERIADIMLTLNQNEEQEHMVPPEMDLVLVHHRGGEGKIRIPLRAVFSIMMYEEVKAMEILP
jgi:replicative DNA helicase